MIIETVGFRAGWMSFGCMIEGAARLAREDQVIVCFRVKARGGF
jgi:hypothetical protein